MAYALGRRLEYYDMPTDRAIVKEAGEDGHKLSAFILAVVKSAAFKSAKAPRPAVAAAPQGVQQGS